MKTTCIMCPMGCELEIEKQKNQIIVFGNKCERGKIYGENEITNPSRIVTTLISTETEMISVKTSEPIPKQKIEKILKIISKIQIKNAKIGEILLKNIDNTNANVIVTGIWQK